MMKSIFKEITLRANEDMREKSTEMFSKLQNIKNFHLKCDFKNTRSIVKHIKRATLSS